MIFSTIKIRLACKIWVLYLQNQTSYVNFSFVKVMRNLHFTKVWNPEILLKFWDFWLIFCHRIRYPMGGRVKEQSSRCRVICKMVLTFKFSLIFHILTVTWLKSFQRWITTEWLWNVLETRYQNVTIFWKKFLCLRFKVASKPKQSAFYKIQVSMITL